MYIYIYLISVGKTKRDIKIHQDHRCDTSGLQVELEHSRFSGKKKVFVDGKLALSTTAKQLSWCYEHPNSKAKIKLDSETWISMWGKPLGLFLLMSIWRFPKMGPLNHPLMDFPANKPSISGKAPFLLWSPGPIQGEWATFAEMQRAREILAALHCPGSGS